MSQSSESQRFEFGKNWTQFLCHVNRDRIEASTESLAGLLDAKDLTDKSFLDIGSGSGLASLSAHALGAAVHSFDFDQASVACTSEMKQRFGSDNPHWRVEWGSILDRDYVTSLGQFDIVYSWGVLHHTGQMDDAIGNAASLVKNGGTLCIAIYNDQGAASGRWTMIKNTYHRLPQALRPAWVVAIAAIYEAKFALARLIHGRNPLPFADWAAKNRDRGMSAWYDWVDWVGGLPFEVSTPERLIESLAVQGFRIQRLKTVGKGWGCNEYVFTRDDSRLN